LCIGEMLHVSYDRGSDVLYVRTGQAVPSVTRAQPDGVLFRFAIDGGEASGVTVLEVSSLWGSRFDKLAEIVSEFLATPSEEAFVKIKDEIGRGTVSLA